MKQTDNLLGHIRTLKRSFVLIFSVAPILCLLLILVILFSATLPVLAIKTSADLINYAATSEVTIAGVAPYLVYWAAFLLINDIINPLIVFLQSNLADKAIFVINSAIIKKSNKIQGLEHFERQDFHNDIQIILSQSYHKPINLVVTLVGLLKAITLTGFCMALLFSQITWFSFITILSIIIHANVVSKMQGEIWEESLGRSPKSRMMNYISSLSINPAYAKEMRLFPIGEYLYKEYTSIFYHIYTSMLRLRRRQLLWPIISGVLALLSNLLALFYLMYLITKGALMVGAVAILIQTLAQLHQSILSFGEQAGWISGHLLFFDKYFAFLEKEECVYRSSNANTLSSKPHLRSTSELEITFDQVSFTYPDGRKSLEGISFSIQPLENLAIVGANGAGKTSLIKLLCGFYAPTSGEIRINGISISEFNLQELRGLIAPVFQDFGAYSLPLKQNIVMGDTDIEMKRLRGAIKEAGMNFVDSLDNKLEEPLGKAFGGTDLSIGQWQKVAIARALYKQARLFILDEPTASLDPVSESKLFDQFANICVGKTTIFITHRLTSVRMANRILLLDKGKQVALGSHNELLQNEPLYKEMFEAQASKYVELASSV